MKVIRPHRSFVTYAILTLCMNFEFKDAPDQQHARVCRDDELMGMQLVVLC